MAESITFPAQVVKVQTLADSGLRLTLDLPETEIVAFAWLAQCKQAGIALHITAQPFEKQTQTNGEPKLETRGIGQSERQTKNAGAVRTAAGRGQQNYRGGRQAHRG